MGAFKKIHCESDVAKIIEKELTIEKTTEKFYVTDVIQMLSERSKYTFYELYKIYEDVVEEDREAGDDFSWESFIGITLENDW